MTQFTRSFLALVLAGGMALPAMAQTMAAPDATAPQTNVAPQMGAVAQTPQADAQTDTRAGTTPEAAKAAPAATHHRAHKAHVKKAKAAPAQPAATEQ